MVCVIYAILRITVVADGCVGIFEQTTSPRLKDLGGQSPTRPAGLGWKRKRRGKFV